MTRLIIFTLISLLMSDAQSGRCNFEKEQEFQKGRRLTATRSETFYTYTSMQCHDLCRRRPHCKAFMFEMKYNSNSRKMMCTIMLEGVDVKDPPVSICNRDICYTSGYINKTKPMGHCS